MEITAESIRENLELAWELIGRAAGSSGERPGDVKIMAVTKTHPPEVVRMALQAGVRLIGENRVSEGGRKVRSIGSDAAEFHMIGPVHTGEVRQAVRDFQWIDSIDRMKVAEEIARRTVEKGHPQPGLLLEVNTSGEDSKHGFPPDRYLLSEVLGSLDELGLSVSGLLTVGPLGGSESSTREAFALLRMLRDHLRRSCGMPLQELSMGMSDDFQLAVMEGATTVRLGRFLFGPRRRR
jgi:pyridoxal phosphate enzyme (YggS family)